MTPRKIAIAPSRLQAVGPTRSTSTLPAGRRWIVAAGVSLLIAVHWLLATTSAARQSPAYDETAHLTAGTSYWQLNDYRLQPENGNLSQRWVSLPLALSSDVRFPPLDQPAWLKSDVDTLGQQFLHRLDNPLEAMLSRSRAGAALLGAAACLAVFFICKELYGLRAAMLSLVLAVASPSMLAHAPLATSDMAATLGFTLSVWCIWRVLQRITVGRLVASGLAVGALMLAKTSGVLILPMTLGMVAVHLAVRRKLVLSWRGSDRQLTSFVAIFATIGGLALLHAAMAMALIWTACGWRYQAHAPGMDRPTLNHHDSLEQVAQQAGAPGKLLAWLGEKRLLPESYLYGAGYVLAEGRQRAAFLCGDYASRGWWYYFPYCLLVKTPLALFGLLAAAAAVRFRHEQLQSSSTAPWDSPLDVSPWLILLAVYWAAAIASSLNIGHRHLLPTYPAMFILAGGAARWCSTSRRGAVAIGLLLTLFLAASARAWPHYLAYFNVLVPRERAYRHLIDSNLDWGQDLPGLKRWLDQQRFSLGDAPVYLSYFGTGSPQHYGIQATRLPIGPPSAGRASLKGGIYCISATNLQAVYLAAPGRWNVTYERDYQMLRELLGKPAGEQLDDPQRQMIQSGYGELQQARLFSFLRHREPDAQVGYSILIYRLSDREVDQALSGPPVELDSLTWQQREALKADR